MRIDAEDVSWIQSNFKWFINEFGIESLTEVHVLTPSHKDLPFSFDGSENVGGEVLRIVANNMGMDYSRIALSYHPDQTSTHTVGDDVDFIASYQGVDDSGRHAIALSKGLLLDPVGLVATLGHELSYIKLACDWSFEDFNDPDTVDLLMVFYGLGVFGANSSYTVSARNGYKIERIGYLSPELWAYALALFSVVRKEEHPSWSSYLSKEAKPLFKRCVHQLRKEGIVNAVLGDRK